MPGAAVRTRAFGARLVLTVVSSGCPFFVTVANSCRRPLKLRPLPCVAAQQSLVASVQLNGSVHSQGDLTARLKGYADPVRF